MKPHHRLLAVAVVLSLTATAPTTWASAPASSTPTAATSAPPTWWALGDSYSSGEGIPGTDSGSLGLGPRGETCERANGSTTDRDGRPKASDAKAWSVIAYERLFDEPTRQRNLTLVACTGAKSDAFDWQVQQAREWSKVDRPDVVSFSFGGNDLGFSAVLFGCLLAPKIDWAKALLTGSALTRGCAHPEPTLRRWVEDFSKPDHSSFATLLDKAAATVKPGGSVIALGYPFLTEESGRWSLVAKALQRCQGISRRDGNMLRGVVALLNQRLAAAVEAAEARHPDVQFLWLDMPSIYEKAGGERHALCSSNGDEWLNGVTIAGGGDLRYQRSFHPNQPGHTATGEELSRKISADIGIDRLTAPTGLTTILATEQSRTDCMVRYINMYRTSAEMDGGPDDLAWVEPWDEVSGSMLDRASTTKDVVIASREPNGELRPLELDDFGAYVSAEQRRSTRYAICSNRAGIYRVEESPPVDLPTSTDVITIDGLGPLKIGATYAEAELATGYPLQRSYPVLGDGDDCIDATLGGDTGIYLMGGDGRIGQITVDSLEIKTRSGIGQGSPESAVNAAYPGRIEITQRPDPPGGTLLTYRPVDTPDRVIVFEIDDGTVGRIRVGTEEFTAYEGSCSL